MDIWICPMQIYKSWHLPVGCLRGDCSPKTDRLLVVGCLVMFSPPSIAWAMGALYSSHVMSQHTWLIQSVHPLTCRFMFHLLKKRRQSCNISDNFVEHFLNKAMEIFIQIHIHSMEWTLSVKPCWDVSDKWLQLRLFPPVSERRNQTVRLYWHWAMQVLTLYDS